MKIHGLLKEHHIFLDLVPAEKRRFLGNFVRDIKRRGLISEERVILDELLKREVLGSTGLEKGIAVPHALSSTVKEPFVALAVVKEGLDFQAADRRPTHVVILILGSKDNPGMQLKILAHVCRLVKETKIVDKLKKASSAHEVCEIFKKEEEKIE